MRVADVVVDRRVAETRKVSATCTIRRKEGSIEIFRLTRPLPMKKLTFTQLLLLSRETHPFMDHKVRDFLTCFELIVKLRQGSGKEGQGMALKAKGLKA